MSRSVSVGRLLKSLTWYKQSAFLWQDGGPAIYVDPWGLTGDCPEADIILITHMHFDHFSKVGAFADPATAYAAAGDGDLGKITGPKTVQIAPHDVARELVGDVRPMAPGDTLQVGSIRIEAVPAYNIAEGRREVHPKAKNWVGFVLHLGDGMTLYHAGDTDHLPELEHVKADVALVPVGGTYGMDVPEAAALVKAMKPQVAVPIHYGFALGTAADGDRFRAAAGPVDVEVFKPLNPFTQ